MANIQVKIINLEQIRAAFAKSPTLMTRNLNLAIKKSLISIQRETILNVGGSRGINVVSHGLLSAAERPPLFESLKGTYLIDIFYAIFVHDGTSRMEARPFLLEAVNTEQTEVNDFMRKAVQDTLDEIGAMT